MPRYKATQTGYMHGRLYGPNTKRAIVHTDKPLKPVPSWLTLIEEETPTQRKKREQEEAKMSKEQAAKAEKDRKDIDAVTFTEAPARSGVETL